MRTDTRGRTREDKHVRTDTQGRTRDTAHKTQKAKSHPRGDASCKSWLCVALPLLEENAEEALGGTGLGRDCSTVTRNARDQLDDVTAEALCTSEDTANPVGRQRPRNGGKCATARVTRGNFRDTRGLSGGAQPLSVQRLPGGGLPDGPRINEPPTTQRQRSRWTEAEDPHGRLSKDTRGRGPRERGLTLTDPQGGARDPIAPVRVAAVTAHGGPGGEDMNAPASSSLLGGRHRGDTAWPFRPTWSTDLQVLLQPHFRAGPPHRAGTHTGACLSHGSYTWGRPKGAWPWPDTQSEVLVRQAASLGLTREGRGDTDCARRDPEDTVLGETSRPRTRAV